MKAIRQLLGSRYPIIQAPMAGISTVTLASAVSNAGGIGSLGLGTIDKEQQVEKAIIALRQLTPHPFNINFFCHAAAQAQPEREQAWLQQLAPLFAQLQVAIPSELALPYRSFIENEALLEVVLRQAPPIVSFHFGLPPIEWTQAMQQRGIVLLATATSLTEAQHIQAHGLDVIVAQGIEAGGHRGTFANTDDQRLSTSILIRQLIKQDIQLPIIAAGGIMDGAGIKAALSLGAKGVQLGTAFILSPESAATADYRAMLASPLAHSTAITSAVSGRPARALSNQFISELAQLDCRQQPDYPVSYSASQLLQKSASADNIKDWAIYWAGQGAPLARELPAAQLLTLLAKEAGL